MDKDKKRTDELLRRPLYIYDLPPEVLSTLALAAPPEVTAQQAGIAPPTQSETSTARDAPSESLAVGSQACSLCGLTFDTVLDQRGHQKSDLHHYNLKQKLRGKKAVSETEFEKLVGDLDELSGSDSSESEDDEEDRKESTLTALLKKQATLAERSNNGDADPSEDGFAIKRQRGSGKPPLLWFSSPVLPANTYYGVYRAIFKPEEANNEAAMVEVIKKKQLEPISFPKPGADAGVAPAAYKGPHIFLCMIGGGHFAAMVVSLAPRQSKHNNTGPLNREATVLAHKTFHRYTTRRKQGGSQSANDNAKGNAHSAGSSIRRYNEQALVDEVRQLLHDWKGLLDTSELLFIRATGSTNRRTLFGPYEDQVLRSNDPRIRGFPFSTRRATENELMRSFIELTRLKVREVDPAQEKAQVETLAKPATPKPAKPAAPKLSEEEETTLLHTSQLQAFVRRSKVPALLTYLKNNSVSADFLFQPADSPQSHHAPTCLHLSASQNSAPLVLGLLTKAGADPTIKSREGKTAFELSGDRSTRDAFRVARDELGEDKWDWESAKVAPPLKRAEAEKRDERERQENEKKEAERRKAEEARLKTEGPKVDSSKTTRVKGALGTGLAKTAQEKREEEARGLTPEQRTRLDRERRARAAEERLRRMQAGS